MRSIVLFQTFVNIILGSAVLFLLNQVDSKIEGLTGIEITAAHSLDESLKMNETLVEILAELRQNARDRAASLAE